MSGAVCYTKCGAVVPSACVCWVNSRPLPGIMQGVATSSWPDPQTAELVRLRDKVESLEAELANADALLADANRKLMAMGIHRISQNGALLVDAINLHFLQKETTV